MRGMAGAVARAGGSAGRAAADFNFLRDGATSAGLDARLTFSRGSSLGATIVDNTGTLRQAPHNYITRSRCDGAVVGVWPGVGSLPAGWSNNASGGLTLQIVAVTRDYVDIRWFGVTNLGYSVLSFNGNQTTGWAVGQQWTESFDVQVVGGSTTGITGFFNDFRPNGAGTIDKPVTLSSVMQRSSQTVTIPGGATDIQPSIAFNWNVGASIDITLRLGRPQLEQNSGATLYVETNGVTLGTAAYGPRIDYATQRNWLNNSVGQPYSPAAPNACVLSTDITPAAAGTGVVKHTRDTGQADTNCGNCSATGLSNFMVLGESYRCSVYMWVPSSYTGTNASISNSAGAVVGAGSAAVNMALRDQWQRLSYTSTAVGTGVGRPGMTVRLTGAATGDVVYTSAPQIEPGTVTTQYQAVTSAGVATTECLGLLMEPASTNLVRNPRFEGATAGVVGSGGVLPTNMLQTGAFGSVVGVGKIGGRDYLDFRMQTADTPASTYGLTFDNVGVSANTAYTSSVYLQVIAGSLSNITVQTSQLYADSGSVLISFTNPTIAPTSAITRFKETGTTPANTAALNWRLRITVAGACDLTLRMFLPQVEQLADVTSPILPPVGAPAATARAADSLTCDPTPYFGRVSRTNLVTNSGDLSTNWTYGNCTRTGGFTAPDGTANAIKLTEDTTNTQKAVSQFVSVANNAIGSTFTVSVFAKAAERTNVAVTMFGEAYATFDLSGGTVTANPGGTATITSVGSGWYRCAWTVTRSNANGTAYFIPLNNGNIYLGDGTSGLYLWGAQVVAGTTPAAYIPTTGSTVTVSEVGPGMVVMDYDTPSIVNLNYHLWSLDDGIGSIANVFGSFINGNALSTTVWMHAGNSNFNQTYDGSQTTIVGATNKYAIAWDGSLVRRSMNAGTVRNTVSSSVYGISRMLIGGQLVGYVIPLNGHVRRFRVFNGAQTAAAVQKATA